MSNNQIEIVWGSRESKREVESGGRLAPKFDSNGLVPVVTTDYDSGEVVMQAFMNEEALKKTIEIGEAVYWSRSRQELWHKGATSGFTQKVIEMRVDCDQDCIWIRVRTKGGANCHVGYRSCFYRSVVIGPDAEPDQLGSLQLSENDKVFDPKKVYGSGAS
jgi:phosphoribosyl-AMP cyclohydrolase